jgi:hypothetical protein
VFIQSEESDSVTENEEISWVAWSMSTDPSTNWFVKNTKDQANDEGLMVMIENQNTGRY